jgi:hypothetical protein
VETTALILAEIEATHVCQILVPCNASIFRFATRSDPSGGFSGLWQAWAETEGGILRAFMSYCLARFQRTKNSRLNMFVISCIHAYTCECVNTFYELMVCWGIHMNRFDDMID